jgi:hypothetical protein
MMAKIKRVSTAQEREQVKQKQLAEQQAKDDLRDRLSQKAKLSQADINELVMMLAREHGLIE